ELIEGEIIDMAPIGSRHAEVVDRLGKRLHAATGEVATVGVQRPVRLDSRSEPQPDLVLLKPRSYANAHPTPRDVLLLIEVSDSTLRFDRDTKVALYARHGIAEVWLVDLVTPALHVFRHPSNNHYRDVTRIDAPGRIQVTALPGIAVDLTGLFEF
ncbi:MAG TPA: Uma2 family endonuclease, partial [Povalibacter sp.]|uniref:Uma2 family endonuclease n=1 Tax=Povalibacter sp. TaxID=1962978 RepID=UPI002C82E44C